AREIVFTRGTTEAINLVAQTYGRQNLRAGDEIIVSEMEHHSNIVPWQLLCEQTGAVLRVVPITDRGEFRLDAYEKLLGPKTKLVAVVHLSNVLGTINPVEDIIRLAHARGVPVLIDGAQAVAHLPVDVRRLDCDFYAFSGHKLYGPTGIGVLYGKAALLEAMPPWQGGGDMIASVSFARTTYNVLPYKFEAGTPDIAGAVGLGAAIDYVQRVGLDAIAAHEADLLSYATARLREVPGLRLLGTAERKGSVLSFVLEAPPVAPLDVGTLLDQEGVAVRTGHHCCQPLMGRLGVASAARASLALYNTREDIDALVAGLNKIVAGAATKGHAAEAAPPANGQAADYPEAAAGSPQEAADDLADSFEFFDDWKDRYQFLIELGAKLLPLPEDARTEAHRVHGCQSTVYMTARKRPGTADVIDFLADSDADLVRGLIAVLQRLYSGQSARQILAFDVEGFFRKLGLDQHLTLGRRNGLASMVQRIRKLAAELA
ncbi:MAG TPA: aminotransferase class V-fold PLP-dependent enzyme, partial [Gemmataceae bacterium]|nr:aminotransferase class V-fold PLP-dependent enzyme [Gemmataceae bacterium]